MRDDRLERKAGAFFAAQLRRHRNGERAAVQALVLGWAGVICHPLFFVVFAWIMPQAYQSPGLRAVGVAIGIAGIVAERMGPRYCELYVPVAVTFLLPFFSTYMFLMNNASGAWAQWLAVAIVALFHMPTPMALRCYVAGTVLALVCAVAQDRGHVILSAAFLQHLPVHWFLIGLLCVARLGRSALEQEKLAGMGEGLGAVAHEMRTPLASMDANVRGLTRMLQGEPSTGTATEDVRQAMTRIQYEVRHMNHLIDLFLLSANAVRRRLDPCESVSMADAVQGVLRRYPFASPAQRSAVAVDVRSNFNFAGQYELTVVILLNLLRNALKAIHRAGKGRVRIVVDGQRKPPRLLFIDTACGIAARHQRFIFQRFYAYPAYNGTGVGLALCRQIMHAWNARIRCVSRESAYAIFVLEFPIQRAKVPSGES
jgi:two-component system CAI-1 autoinducer sensor kinase/phosphatase CqsS